MAHCTRCACKLSSLNTVVVELCTARKYCQESQFDEVLIFYKLLIGTAINKVCCLMFNSVIN